MAELARPKKPKHRDRPREAPPIPNRPTIVNGIRLPDVPRHMPEVSEQQNEIPETCSASPEPEELVLSDDSEEEKEGNLTEASPPIPPRTITNPTIMARATSLTVESNAYPKIPQITELPSYTAALNHPTIYPQIIAKPSLTTSQSAAELPSKTRCSAPVMFTEAPPIYPTICAYERNENGLMTEENLLHFYHNPLYENAENYVDQFVNLEEVPINHGCLFSLLKRFKEICEQIELCDLKEKETAQKLQSTQKMCWKQENLETTTKGQCGENRNGMGLGKYQSFVLQEPTLQQMSRCLSTDRSNLLDHRLCEEAIAKSLALQIQWQIIEINNAFMKENNLSLQSPPKLVTTGPFTPARTRIRKALSDLFYHLRFPRLTKKNSDAIIGWIRELICVLNMNQSWDDGLYILCHLLRLPSPIDNWAPAFVQTFIQSDSPPKLKIDYCIAILTHLLNPIRARESFLQHIGQSEKEESTWEILADDDGEIDEFSFVKINEVDLIALLDQMPISELFLLAKINFSSYADKGNQFTAMIAFQLLLMKILDSGLTNYAKPGFKLFCKQIGICLKHSVQEFCRNWEMVKHQVEAKAEHHLQREVDRIVLLALNYLIHRDSVGLFQFVVSLPYGAVSEECRNRCEFALKSKEKMTIHELYNTPLCEVQAKIKLYSIKHRLESLERQDAEFLVNSLASIGSYSRSDINQLISDLINVCFCDESTRNELYKCGGEAIGQIIDKRPDVLQQLLTIIDRNLEHINTYAINVLSSSKLEDCRLTESLMSIIGKWLINYPIEHGGNRLARRILSGLYWGPSSDGQTLWIDDEVHSIMADTIVKAHSVHCSHSNGMISKSIKQITKLASKVGDSESHFQQFCWDLLVKLKLSNCETQLMANDLTSHYVTIIQKYEGNVDFYIEKGVPLLSDLVTSGSSVASVVLMCRLIAQHYNKVQLLANEKNFMMTFERLLHVDQLSYAIQWITGPSAAPTPIVKLICSAISYYATRVENIQLFLKAWLQLLCEARTDWNEDAVTYQIVGTIIRIAFLHDPTDLFNLSILMQNVYTQKLITEKNASSRLFSMFTSDSPPSPLIPDSMLSISPFATYFMLMIEEKAFDSFYTSLFECLAKKDKYSLEDGVRKATAKVSMSIPIERISVFRWAKFVALIPESEVLPLAIQRLTIEAFKLRKVNGTLKLCYARKLLNCEHEKLTMEKCQTAVRNSSIEMKGLGKAAIGWWTTSHDITRQGFDFSIFDLDYLLQLILAGDQQPWCDFVDLTALNAEELNEQKLYATTCQLTAKTATLRNVINHGMSASRNGATATSAVGFPILPIHSALPSAVDIDLTLIVSMHKTRQVIIPILETIHRLAERFANGCDELERDDDAYLSLMRKLYQPTKKMIPVTISCSSKCVKISTIMTEVQINEFDQIVDTKMSENRNKRIQKWNELNAELLNKTAVATASLEHFARRAAQIASESRTDKNRDMAIQVTGRAMIDAVTSSINNVEVGFAASLEAFRWVLKELGEEFVKFRAEEQTRIMELVLDGFVLSEPLVEVFTPEVLNSNDLCAAYQTLSKAVRMPQKSKMALQLLGRLGMQQAAAGLPPHQFASLLPIAFVNLTSQPDSESPLHVLCLQHVVFFVFHQFPTNIVAGLDLTIEGCSSNSTPPALLDIFVDKLGAQDFVNRKSEYELGGAKAKECAIVIGRRLDEARRKVPNFYRTFGKYLNSITKLMQLFLYIPIRDSYQENQPLTVLQRELYEDFGHIVVVFSPLIAPYSPAHPPFLVSNEDLAMLVFDRFIELLKSLHYNANIPPGMQNIQALVWQFYYEKLSILTHGTEHYYDVLERQLIRLNWQTLWPSKLAIDAMEACLEMKSINCASFVVQIVVRIPWNGIFQQMSSEDRKGYMASLFTVLVRIVPRSANYEKVRASFLEMIKSLSTRNDWLELNKMDVERIAKMVEKCLPAGSVSNSTEIISVVHVIWRKICNFMPRVPFSLDSIEKQKIWLKTECALLLKSDPATMPAAYNSLVSDVNSLAVNHENLQSFCAVAQELTTFWKFIADVKLGESIVNIWTEYLMSNVTSSLVLTSLKTLIRTLEARQLSTALKVMEKTIEAYFLRTTCSWVELNHWIEFPKEANEEIQKYLLTVPRSDNKVQALPLTLKTFLDQPGKDENVFLQLYSYILNIKPKHIQNEGAFVCLLARMGEWLGTKLSEMPNRISPSDDLLPPLIQWLKRSSKDETGFFTSLISSKKTAHSPKLRIVLQIFEFYLTQQTLGDGRRPRSQSNSPILNSRLNGLKELAEQKANQHMSAAFNKATEYFVQVENHHIKSTSKMLLDIGKCTFGDNFLSDV